MIDFNIDKTLIKNYHKNPRQITRDRFQELQGSMGTHGDISPIMINLNTMELLGGNQRDGVINLADAEFEWHVVYDEVGDDGIKAQGYVIYKRKRFNVTAGYWDDITSEKLNIKANKIHGSWDYEILFNQFEPELLVESGWSVEEMSGDFMDGDDDDLGQPEGSGDVPEKSREQGKAFIIEFDTPDEALYAEEALMKFIEDSFPEATILKI